MNEKRRYGPNDNTTRPILFFDSGRVILGTFGKVFSCFQRSLYPKCQNGLDVSAKIHDFDL